MRPLPRIPARPSWRSSAAHGVRGEAPVRGVATVRGVAHVRGEAQGRGVAGGRAPDMGLAGVVASFLSRVARLSGAALGLAVALGGTPVALAHGGRVPDLPPDAANLALGWSGDPLVWLPALVALLLWRTAVRRINRTHPATPVPAWRTWAWVAGVAVVVIALDSGIERYDTTLFWVHMIQHMLLTLVAPPLLLLAAPITVLLRAVSPETRRRRILPLLHARAVRLLSFPIVAWVVFAAVMWGSHFSPLFDASLENDWIHRLEHGLFVVAALLFWWPAIGADPSPWRMRPAVRVIYVGLQMPQNTFLALAIYMATSPLYRHYVTTVRSWGPTPLEDQQLAGGIMWIGGDLAFLTVVILLVLVWMRDEERRTVGEDRRLAAAEAAIRERSARLASRRAAEAGVRGAGWS